MVLCLFDYFMVILWSQIYYRLNLLSIAQLTFADAGGDDDKKMGGE
jgi:hypothetical protein